MNQHSGFETLTPIALDFKKGIDIAPVFHELTIPVGNFFVITGTSYIDEIAAASSREGRMVILKFASTAGMADGNNLKIAGDFFSTANDTITLICDGTDWYEISRSVN